MMKLAGEVGVKIVEEFYADLMDELDGSDDVIIDFTDVSRVDLSVMQVIIVAGRYAKDLGKVVKLKSVSREMKYQMFLCGLKI